jgi:hypothetical protein
MIRALLTVVFVMAMGMWSAPARAAASDPHPPAKPAPAANPHPPAKPAATAGGQRHDAGHAKPAEPAKASKPVAAAKPAAASKPAAAKAATAAELEALNDRIHQRIAEVAKMQKSKASAVARTHAAPAPAPPAARVRLVWRASVAWPQELHEVPRAPSDDRVSVSWGTAP